MFNKIELGTQRIEPLSSPSGTHMRFFLDFVVIVVFSNRLTL